MFPRNHLEVKKSEASYLAELQNNGLLLESVPYKEVTKNLCLAAVQQNGLALQFVPPEMMTETLCFSAVQNDGWALQYVPRNLITEKLCFAAVQQNGEALQDVPPDMMTEKLCLAAVQQSGRALKFVPDELITEAICLAAVQQNGMALRDVPEEFTTEKICLAAVKKNGLALRSVPPEIITDKLCLLAIQENGEALSSVPPEMITDKLCLLAVQQNGLALYSVPPDKKTDKLCLAAVQQNGEALQDVPPEMVTDKLTLAAVQQNGLAIKYVVNKTEKLCLMAVQQNGLALKDVPPEMINDELCFAAVQQNGLALEGVPVERITEKLSLPAVQQNGLALQHVPNDIRTKQIYLEAVRQNGKALKWVPDEYKASIIKELSVKAILANNYQALRFFPKEHQFQEEINEFLATVTHVLMNKDSTDHELYDIQATYANKKNRISVCINGTKNSQKDLNQLLTDLETAKNTHPLHLGLIDHANKDSTQLSGISFQEIPGILKQHPTIQHVHLLGCNVAKAKLSVNEKQMIEAFQKKSLKDETMKFGFASASIKDEELNEGIKKKCIQLCKKQKLNGVYILNKKDEKTYVLYSIKYDPSSEKLTKITMKEIPSTRIPNLKHILDNQKKDLSFPKSPSELIYIRDQKPLSPTELQSLRSTAYETARYERDHPKYQKDKKSFPSLAKIKVEVDDLQDSLIKKMATAIGHSDIDRDITLHGATKALHVDTAKRDFKVTRTHLYPSSYNQSFFGSKQPNIDEKKLNEERKKEIAAMKEGKIDDESHAKGISVTVKKN